jgi:hypothetical protein
VVVAAPDAMGAVGALTHLRRLGLPVTAIAGRITRSPLATREAQAMSDVPILTLDELGEDEKVARLFGATRLSLVKGPSSSHRPSEAIDLATFETGSGTAALPLVVRLAQALAIEPSQLLDEPLAGPSLELVDANSGNGHRRVNGHGRPDRLGA